MTVSPAETTTRPRLGAPARLALILCSALFGASLFGQWVFLQPLPRNPVRYEPSQFGMPNFRPVELHPDAARGDDLTLNAWFIPGARAETVVLCHGRGDSRAGMLPVAQLVHDAGYSALVMEFRAHGDSGGTWSSIGAAEQRDLLAALDWLDGNGSGPVAAFGYSMGGGVALCVAADDVRIRGVVTEGAVASVPAFARHHYGPLAVALLRLSTPWVRLRTGASPWDARAVAVIDRIAPRPVLLIHSRQDRVVPYSAGEALYAAAQSPKELWTLPDAPHVAGVIRHAHEYRRRLTAFLDRVFAEPAAVPGSA